MSSERRIRAARANGAKSRGPKTPEGRARSAQNSTTHGLTAAKVVLANESRQEFQAVQQAYLDQFQPRTQLEADLLAQLVAARWRLQRVWAMETALLDLEMMRLEPDIQRDFESIAEDTRTALAFRSLADNSRTLALLERYETRYRRTFERVLDTLHRLRNPPSSPPNENLPNEPKPETEHTPGKPAAGSPAPSAPCAATPVPAIASPSGSPPAGPSLLLSAALAAFCCASAANSSRRARHAPQRILGPHGAVGASEAPSRQNRL